MKSQKLLDTKLSDRVVTTTNTDDSIIAVSCAEYRDGYSPIAELTVEGTKYVMSAQSGNYLSANKLSVVSLTEYAQVSSTLQDNGIFYFTYD